MSKESAGNAGDSGGMVRSRGWEDLLEKGMATHSSILSWRIPWTEEPGGAQSIGGCKELDLTEVTEHTGAQFSTSYSNDTLSCL